jgi:hypothetical protein
VRGALIAWAAALLACGCGTEKGPPSQGSFTLTFPSTAAAVTTDTVQIFVFEVADGGVSALCPSLIERRRSKQQLPPRLLELPPTSPCDLAAGKQQLNIPYGVRGLLAVGQRGGEDYLIGCAVEPIGDGDAPVPIQLTMFSSTVAVPSTSCQQLSQKCQRQCK